MPTRQQIIEDILGAVEERFYKELPARDYPDYFGGRVEIVYSTKPKLEIKISEAGRPGPKVGSKNKKRIGPSKRALKEMQQENIETEI